MERKKWTAVAFTATDEAKAHAFQRELEIQQSKGLIDPDVPLFVVEDPKLSVGSGGATLNALLIVTEHLSAKAGHTVCALESLDNASILILHMGKDFPFCAFSRAFTSLPAKCDYGQSYSQHHSITCNLNYIYDILTHNLCVGSPPGVWVSSTDCLIYAPPGAYTDWSDPKGFKVFAVPGDINYACNHGVLKIGKEGNVEDIFFRGSVSELKECRLTDSQVPIVPGIVYMGVDEAKRFISLHAHPPLDACTYIGLDSGADPIQLSLVYDILLCMATEVSEEEYVSGSRSTPFGGYKGDTGVLHKLPQEKRVFMKGARKELWKRLRHCKFQAVIIENGLFDYMDVSGLTYRRHMLKCPLPFNDDKNNNSEIPFIKENHCHTCIKGECKIANETVIINSMIDGEISVAEDCIITHSHIVGRVTVGKGCILNSLRDSDFEAAQHGLVIPEDTILQGFEVNIGKGKGNHRIITIFGVYDNFMAPVSDSGSTFCNKSWNDFFQRTGLRIAELWTPDVPEKSRCLFTAKLFPVCCINQDCNLNDALWLAGVIPLPESLSQWRSSWKLSMQEILRSTALNKEFDWRRKLFYENGKHQVVSTLMNGTKHCLLPFFNSCSKEGFFHDILETLDEVACTTESPANAARTLACIADVLGCKAGHTSGLRSGPAANREWKQAFQLLEKGDIKEGVKELARGRKQWLVRPDLLIRAARHYEGAEQILVRKAVSTVKAFVNLQPAPLPPMGMWVIAEAPARMDLSGAWSDTPPICYEHGGSVTNFAFKVNGKKPIGAKVRRIPELQLVLVVGSGADAIRIICKKISDLKNYSQPKAPGSLLKAAFCCVDIVSLSSTQSLQSQLSERYGGGFELHSWSNVPHGSGLGASSILAGAIVAAILHASGRTHDLTSVIHLVLLIEQMLTTGGGWQDQVGGLLPDIKIGRSKPSLPLHVESTILPISPEIKKRILEHVLIIYTGKTRLAKNMLQDVVRNWYSQAADIIQTVKEIQSNAEDCARAVVRGDLAGIGNCLNNSWEQKKIMAPGCEPHSVFLMIQALKPFVHGLSLSGAGGGGFLCVVTREANMHSKIKQILDDLQVEEEPCIYNVELDEEGLTVREELES